MSDAPNAGDPDRTQGPVPPAVQQLTGQTTWPGVYAWMSRNMAHGLRGATRTTARPSPDTREPDPASGDPPQDPPGCD